MLKIKGHYLLIDCNNFFASCERIFRPDWQHRPLVVLSGNDGCIIARSPESKKLGFQMGDPYFKVKDQLQLHRVVVCSSNFPLYSDISRRVMNTLEDFSDHMEIYSVDEAFLYFDKQESQSFLLDIAHEIVATIKKNIGIDVSIGIAPTKTLAKLANYKAKRLKSPPHIESFYDPDYRREQTEKLPVEEVWGIGKRMAPKFRSLGIRTVSQIIDKPEEIIQRHFGVVGSRIQLELQGISCLDKLGEDEHRQQIMSTRSFGQIVTSYEELKESLHFHVDAACTQLRRENLCASNLTIMIRAGSIHLPEHEFYEKSASFRLDNPSDNTHTFGKLASLLLEQIWRPGLRYKKSGIMLSDLQESDRVQLTFSPQTDSASKQKLMQTLDKLRASGHAVKFASQGLSQQWATKRDMRTPGYTTSWDELPIVH